eukprot:gene8685-1556_t
MKELHDLMHDRIEGINVVMNDQDISTIDAEIYGPKDTPFEGGVFQVRLNLGSDYPDGPPKGWFLTKIFHPNVSNKGEICVNTLKRDWQKDLGIKHVLTVIRCLLIEPNPDSALNEEAGMLLLEEYSTYFTRAQMYTKIHACTGKEKENSAENPNQ